MWSVTRSIRALRTDPGWLRHRLPASVLRRTIRTAVDQNGHQMFVLVIEGSTDPPAARCKAVDATAAGRLICAQQDVQA